MSHVLIAAGAVIAVIAVAAPIAAIFLVSVASRREESEHTLAGQAPGAVTRAARRLLAYRTQTERPPWWAQEQALRTSQPARRTATRPSAVRRPARPARPAVQPVIIPFTPDAGQSRREPAGTHAA
ncbi:MAG TPA: hypothetical protein VF843_00790 [Streptosporangiaceae bacterium]